MRDCDVLPNDSFKALDQIFSNDRTWSSCFSYSFIHCVLVYLAYIHTLAYSNIHALQYSSSWKKNGQERNSSYDNSTINCSRNKSSSSADVTSSIGIGGSYEYRSSCSCSSFSSCND